MDGLKFTALTLVALMLLPFASAGGSTGGEDTTPNADEVPFSVLHRDSPSVSGKTWSLSLEMNEEEHNNGSTMQITTQICTNDGVCDPPVLQEAEVEDAVYSISLTPPADHSYVNWRVKVKTSDGESTNYPQGDWFKTWSDCYYTDGSWGGPNSEEDGCKAQAESEGGFLPGFVAITAITGLGIAAIRRK